MIQSIIAETISEWVEKSLNLPFTIFSDLISDSETDGACIRHDPSPAAEKRYSDGSRLVSWNFTFYIRCKNSQDAREHAKKIIDLLDGQEIESIDKIKIYCEAITLPQFIDIDAKSFTTYSASIKCTFLEEK